MEATACTTQQSQIESSVNMLYDKYINNKCKESNYKCPHPGCNKFFATRDSLRRHMNRHSTSKEHICRYCQKAFLRKSECEIHERIHTGVKPFECPICGKAFARTTDLKIHMVYHSDEKPFMCPFPGCGLGFKRKSDAKKHLRVHVRKCHNLRSIDFLSAFHPVPKEHILLKANCVFLLM